MKKIILILFSVLVVVFILSSLFKQKEIELKAAPNKVVFILVDTLRADHLPFYDYKYNTTPFLNSLMDDSILFKNFYSTSSYTAPATASLFTSLYQKDHGVKLGFIYTVRDNTMKLNKIPEDAYTLGELFKDAGYKTYAISDNLNISKEMGFSQGFDEMITTRYKGASKVNENILNLKKQIEANNKYFLYIHYIDPHTPYHLQTKWARKGLNEKKGIVKYDSEISYVDDAIKQLYKEFNWDKDTLIIFTSDHGEAFGERLNRYGKKERGHGKTLNREVLRVPLFFYQKGLKKKELSFYASHLDVLPTLSSLLGIAKKDYWKGDDLSKVFVKNIKLKPRYLFADLEAKQKIDNPSIHSIIYNDYHYIKSSKTSNFDEKEELFSWKNDPIELNSNLNLNSELLTDFQTRIIEHLEVKSIFKEENVDLKLDNKLKEHLTTLGYIN